MKKLFKVLVFGALIAVGAQLVQAKKAEWENLTEAEVRTKLDGKLGTRVPEDKLSMIQDKVVDKLLVGQHHRVARDAKLLGQLATRWQGAAARDVPVEYRRDQHLA